jgi:plasmid stabilization system protein ParE
MVITDEALNAIQEQARYIAHEGQSPQAAARWPARVLKAADSLESMPRRCPVATESKSFAIELRAKRVDEFLLTFAVADGSRTVLEVSSRHARQMPRKHG